MKRINQEELDAIATYMDGGIREQVASELAPCEPEEFLIRYCELVPEFEDLLKDEFSIELNNGKVFKANEDDEDFTEEELADIEKHQQVRKLAECGNLEEAFWRSYARVPKALVKKLSPEELAELTDAFYKCFGDGKKAR